MSKNYNKNKIAKQYARIKLNMYMSGLSRVKFKELTILNALNMLGIPSENMTLKERLSYFSLFESQKEVKD